MNNVVHLLYNHNVDSGKVWLGRDVRLVGIVEGLVGEMKRDLGREIV